MTQPLSFDSNLWDNTIASQRPRGVDQESLQLNIVYEDDSLLVLNKPAGLPVQADLTGANHLLELARQARPTQSIYLVHRLDRPVTGLVVLAKTAACQTDLTRQMKSRDFQKTYRAIVSPVPCESSGILEDLLVKDTQKNFCRVVNPDVKVPHMKRARLSFRVLESATLFDQSCAMLEVTLETGRHHQIRVQLSHAGWPIVNDAKYGGFMMKDSLAQLALQACLVRFIHPVTRKTMLFDLPSPSFIPWSFFSFGHG